MGEIRDRAEQRWRVTLPARGSYDNLTWLAVKNVLWPMLREMADELEGLRDEVETLRASREKRKR